MEQKMSGDNSINGRGGHNGSGDQNDWRGGNGFGGFRKLGGGNGADGDGLNFGQGTEQKMSGGNSLNGAGALNDGSGGNGADGDCLSGFGNLNGSNDRNGYLSDNCPSELNGAPERPKAAEMAGGGAFSNLSETARLMLGAICALFAALLPAGLLAASLIYPFEEPLPFAAGLLCGCLLSAAKVILLEKTLARSVDREPASSAKAYATLQALLRYGGTIAVLLCAVAFPRVIGVFGIAAGILTLQISAYAANFMLKKRGNPRAGSRQ
jgi:membrane protein YqaA with SNARE-associated domain